MSKPPRLGRSRGRRVRPDRSRSARVSDPAETADRRSPAILETFGRRGGSVGDRPQRVSRSHVSRRESELMSKPPRLGRSRGRRVRPDRSRSARVSDPAETADRRSPAILETFGRRGGSVGDRPQRVSRSHVSRRESELMSKPPRLGRSRGRRVRPDRSRSARVSDPAETADRRSPAILETFGRRGGSVGDRPQRVSRSHVSRRESELMSKPPRLGRSRGRRVRPDRSRSARVSDPAETADRRSPAILETFGRRGGSVGDRPQRVSRSHVSRRESELMSKPPRLGRSRGRRVRPDRSSPRNPR
jgi:hypothetical protein